MLTKQDIQRIAEYLKRLSVRDTEFPITSIIDENTRIPVIYNDRNRLIYLAVLVDYVIKNINVGSMPISIDGIDSTQYKTLKSVIEYIKSLINTGSTPEEFNATDIMCTDPTGESESSITIQAALTKLFEAIGETGEPLFQSYQSLIDQLDGYVNGDLIDILNQIRTDIDANTASTSTNTTNISNLGTRVTAIEQAGYVTNDEVDAAIEDALKDIKENKLSLYDGLDSESDTLALTAKQGNVLKGAVDKLRNSLANLAFEDGRPDLWQISDGVLVRVHNDSPLQIVVDLETATVQSGGFAKFHVTPAADKFLSATVKYVIDRHNGTQQEVKTITIDDNNKRGVEITVLNITGETDVYVTGTSRNKVVYNVYYPSDITSPYVQFTPSNETITEGETFRSNVGYADIAIEDTSFTITGFKVQHKKSTGTDSIDFNDFPTTLTVADVKGEIVISTIYQMNSQSFTVYGLESNNGYEWTNNNLTDIYENQSYRNTIKPTNGYRLLSVQVTHNGATTNPMISSNGECVINIPVVKSNIVFTIQTEEIAVQSSYHIYLSPQSSGIQLIPIQEIRAGETYQGQVKPFIASDQIPFTISLVDAAGQPLQTGEDYGVMIYSPSSGRLVITNVYSDIYVLGNANSETPIDPSSGKRIIKLKLMNVDYQDSNSNHQYVVDNFGYSVVELNDFSQGYSITLAPKELTINEEIITCVMNGDVTVKCGGVTRFKENGNNNNDGISFNSENNTLIISESVFNNTDCDGQIDIIATARTGVITIQAEEALSNVYINDNQVTTWGEQDSTTGLCTAYVGNAENPITSITNLSRGAGLTHLMSTNIVSIDFGGIPMDYDGSNNYVAQLFQNCAKLSNVSGMVIRGAFTGFNSMFYQCLSLTSIDGIYSWNVSAATSLMFMFYKTSIETLDVEDWETSANLTNIYNAFGGNFQKISLGDFNTQGLIAGNFNYNYKPLVSNSNRVIIQCVAINPPGISTDYNWIEASKNKINNNTIYVPVPENYENSDWKISEILFVEF